MMMMFITVPSLMMMMFTTCTMSDLVITVNVLATAGPVRKHVTGAASGNARKARRARGWGPSARLSAVGGSQRPHTVSHIAFYYTVSHIAIYSAS